MSGNGISVMANPRLLDSYRDSVLPPSVVARVAIEAGVSQGWAKYVGPQGCFLGLDRFGTSAGLVSSVGNPATGSLALSASLACSNI